MSRKQTLLLGGFYFILCLLVQIILLWGFHKRLDVLWLIGLALIVFGYAGASHISLELRRPAYQPVRQPREATGKTTLRLCFLIFCGTAADHQSNDCFSVFH